MATSLADRLAPIIAKNAESGGAHCDRMTAFVEKIGQVAQRLVPGNVAPDFVLPAHDGSLLRLSDLIRDAPLVLFFIRGMWCPYCREQMHAVKDAAPEFAAAGLKVAIITPEVGGRGTELATELGGTFPVLCDVDSATALAYGCLYSVPSQDRAFLKADEVDLAALYGTQAWFIPLPSVFGIRQDGVIVSVFGGPDPRLRPEPVDVLNVVRQATSDPKD